jgi:hypothetical protein
MRASILALALGLGLTAASAALAQTNRTPPSSVTLTGEQWACLATRMNNLQRSSSDVVRVPLSPCGQGSGTRGTGNPTVRQPSGATTPNYPGLTRSPLYLSKAQLACIQRQLPDLQRGSGPRQVDLTRCTVN